MSELTVPELKALCKEKGIKGYSKLRKAELIKLCSTNKASRKVTRKASRKVTRKASRKPTRKASRKVSRKASRKASNIQKGQVMIGRKSWR